MRPQRCPICNRLFDPEKSTAMPFCSFRCKRIDWRRWLDEKYGLPYQRAEEETPADLPEDEDGGPVKK